MGADAVKIRVLLFGSYGDWMGQESLDLTFEGSATVADLVHKVRAIRPGGERIPTRPLAAVNAAHSPMDTPLHDGDEVALLPPLAGG
jgi:molybdopterin converting factor small subunit